MTIQITTITTPFTFGVSVNCYFVDTGDGYVLIDTGMPKRRKQIETALEEAGCQPGALKLIVLTHGDIDHCGNARYFRERYGSRNAMHREDVGMVEAGRFFSSRKKRNLLLTWMMNSFFALSPPDRFTPDLLLDDGDDLSECGLDARIVGTPGHSRGSIGIITAAGDLFCGDLLANTDRPELWSIMDDASAARASLTKLASLDIGKVFPGHGNPFAWASFHES